MRNFFIGIFLLVSCSSFEDVGFGEINITETKNTISVTTGLVDEITTGNENTTIFTEVTTSDENTTTFDTEFLNETSNETVNESTGENIECECDDNELNCHNCIRDRLIFVTSESVFRDWGKSPTLDDKCNQLAYKAGLLDGYNKRFNTWISTNQIDARERSILSFSW